MGRRRQRHGHKPPPGHDHPGRAHTHLHLAIYKTFLGLMLVTVLLTMAAARILWHPDEDRPPRLITRGASLIVTTLPNDEPIGHALQKRAEELDVSLSLWSSAGNPVANPDGHSPPQLGVAFDWTGGPGRQGGFSLQLDDGRYLKLLSRKGDYPEGPWPILFMIGFVLVGLAIATHPVARRITRRLQALQHGVERFGTGELGTRVSVRGRDEVARVATAFNAAASQIEALVSQQRRMLASASHELRAPLSRIRMTLELALDGESSIAADKRARMLAEAAEDIEELDGLVDDLLMAARLSREDHPAPATAVDLAEAIQHEAERVGVPCELDAAPVRGDRRMLRRLVRNLLDNARKYGGSEPPTLKLTTHGEYVRLHVCDRGPGVPADQQDRIFEPFYRPQGHAETRDGGVGLGLSLVRQIAHHHGGQVHYRDREGGGSCFEVELPRWRPESGPQRA